ncbi:putative DDE-like endonuclease [Phytophthora infestans]|uniref:Putative DDE-like endonuclease n=1 Tax=Phytophthora infestans TaxID=4787 RepID=A0A8S9V2M7_PHYIN|nr:putative DDE-like endonuclease [Phytophthora infestans]
MAQKIQPSNSPDMICLDLSLFNAIQARQQQCSSRNVAELVKATTDAYWELLEQTLSDTFLSLQCVMDSCICEGGESTYKVAHMSKTKLRRGGETSSEHFVL